MALTRRQKQVLDFLVGFINRRGYSPSFEEIGASLKLSSLATVHKHLQTLEKKGFIRRGYNQSRSVEVVAVPGTVPFAKTAMRALGGKAAASGSAAPPARPAAQSPLLPLVSMEFPLLGRIAAGQPVEAISNPETLSLGDIARGKSNIYVLRVKGDSMIDDHICDGDYILVEGAETASNGDIVVALTANTDATLKRFFREPSGRVRLQPANAQMEPILLPAREVKIQGKVIGVLRKY
ncbi:MAG: transcriptional repressor LexA [Acidobacteria bacterium]|nr:transcriptional repressor LexA [Acidobacteriota bacterium]